jgi:hypothetical protein
MSSDQYERVVKLWISLWNLVLEEKRHIESVCTVLQKLVFEKTSWPKFKNWLAICELGKKDHLMMLAIATLELSKDDESTQRVIAAFPECFSEVETRGPVPWSVLQQTSIRLAIENHGDVSEECAKKMLICYEALAEYHIPYQEFYYFADEIDVCDRKRGVMPITDELAEIEPTVGSLVKWEGKHWIIVEDRHDGTRLSNPSLGIAPAECIDMSL